MKNNSVHLIGALTRDIELSKNSKGNSFVRFTLACTRDNKPFTDFINCIAFSEVANALCKHRNKDTAYEINGYLRISSYEKDGKNPELVLYKKRWEWRKIVSHWSLLF